MKNVYEDANVESGESFNVERILAHQAATASGTASVASAFHAEVVV